MSTLIHLCSIFSFDLQLENFGLDLQSLKATVPQRIFRAWVEEWEKAAIMENDPVAEAQLLEKYKNIVFLDPDTEKSWKIYPTNLEWFKASKRQGISKGWHVIGISEDDEEESFEIEDELLSQMADTPQEEGVVVIRRGAIGEEGEI